MIVDSRPRSKMAASAMRITAVLRAGVALRGAEPSKSFERPLTELVTCPLTAPKVLAASKILLSLERGELLNSIRKKQHAQLRARHGCINFRRIAAFPAASRSLRRRRDQQYEYK